MNKYDDQEKYDDDDDDDMLPGFDDDDEPIDELEKTLRDYEKHFGRCTFPTIPLRSIHGDERCIKIMKDCISRGKDIYELGYYKEPPLDVYI